MSQALYRRRDSVPGTLMRKRGDRYQLSPAGYTDSMLFWLDLLPGFRWSMTNEFMARIAKKLRKTTKGESIYAPPAPYLPPRARSDTPATTDRIQGFCGGQ